MKSMYPYATGPNFEVGVASIQRQGLGGQFEKLIDCHTASVINDTVYLDGGALWWQM
jgi:hypothetical protein